ncbi:phosphate ABC transporter substrate-binding protein PstS [Asticcacaulis sp.]|jgi:phosphate transport system substrate-binding protein|uniref:phosphate ABC transporter substrate-binding protein PstS n=1 Tax=unclassified Asticcacaulis TaxID=2628350 RepID=UPI0025B944FF|nr:phosphate ABC transporter substrate-binding protein PstS [Asticcacaulis sp.]MCA1936004.1 phosphate ABC transporter substrate-binding protein PstS [Asticcacaulis sp.]
MFKPFALALGALLMLTACSDKGAATAEGKDAPAAGDITGAGSTFFAPLGAKWAETYKETTGIRLNYQSIGSGGGVRQIKVKTVDFGATDKPVKPADLDETGLLQFPIVMGGIVPIVNLPDIKSGQMNLTGPLLADIYMGKVKRWDDPAIRALNPGLKLPHLPITVIHRADGSGTTFLFSNYLAKVSPTWKEEVGAADALEWPAGLGGKGNEGVSAFVKQTLGAIGYVEFAVAARTGTAVANMRNHDGHMIAPSIEAFAAAAAGADWANAPGNQLLLLDQPGAQAWPITGTVFIVMHKTQDKPASGRAALTFFDWAYTNGDALATRMHYVPLPPEVKQMMRAQWSQITGPDGKPVYAPATPAPAVAASAASAQ